MKNNILILSLLVSCAAQAQEFKFVYTLGGTKLEYKTDADTWEQAFKRGSQFCFNFFVNKEQLTEDRGLDIIDVCANPR